MSSVDPRDSGRRLLLQAGLGVSMGLMITEAAVAEAPRPRASGPLVDRLAVADLVTRERAARDASQWTEMAACYAADSHIEISWFQGTGKDFVAASQKNLSARRLSQHLLAPTTALVSNNRAIAETPCQLLGFVSLDDLDVCVVGTARLVWRAVRQQKEWLIAGLRMIYIRDLLLPCNPSRTPTIPAAELETYRLSYRYLSYVLARSDHPARDDLPGIDRPDLVASLLETERAWLTGS
jgi:hypothetical protein